MIHERDRRTDTACRHILRLWIMHRAVKIKKMLGTFFGLLSYESLNDTWFSDNRFFCTWPADIALPSGGDAYWFYYYFIITYTTDWQSSRQGQHRTSLNKVNWGNHVYIWIIVVACLPKLRSTAIVMSTLPEVLRMRNDAAASVVYVFRSQRADRCPYSDVID